MIIITKIIKPRIQNGWQQYYNIIIVLCFTYKIKLNYVAMTMFLILPDNGPRNHYSGTSYNGHYK